MVQGRSRVAWDYSSLVKIVSGGNYGRVIELQDGSLAAVAGGRGGAQFTISKDRGATWSVPRIVAPDREGISMSVPEIIQLRNGNLLLSYNPRPRAEKNVNPNLLYGMRVRISENLGRTWSKEIKVYDAGMTKASGCWEPFTMEMPSGEIQLYFANENEYFETNEQNITMCRSTDGGRTWSAGETVSFRAKHRDGMPSVLYLEHSGESILAIEDNGYASRPRRMTPTIIRTKDDWKSGFVSAESDMREAPLVEELLPMDNGAAPYICKSRTGEILLSYQGSENRDVPISKFGIKTNDNSQEMFVAVGDRDGRNFINKTTPFRLPLGPDGVFPENGRGYQGLWNSVASMSDGVVWAVSSTNGFPQTGGGVYGMKGYMIGDIEAQEPSKRVKIDGEMKEWSCDYPDIVVAHELGMQLFGYVTADRDGVNILFKVCGAKSDRDLKDGVEVCFAAGGERFAFTLQGGAKSPKGVEYASGYDKQSKSYVMECRVPAKELKAIGAESSVSLSVTLCERVKSGVVHTESIVHSNDDPTTWIKIKSLNFK